MITAKPVVNNQFWILKQDDKKIGNIEAVDNGFQLKINNQVSQFKTIKSLAKRTNIEFAVVGTKKDSKTPAFEVHGYPAGCRIHNPIWDVKHKLPLFTKTEKSKSWFASGWYCVKQHRHWTVEQSPKLITLQRYKYQGPFHTKEEANDKSVS